MMFGNKRYMQPDGVIRADGSKEYNGLELNPDLVAAGFTRELFLLSQELNDALAPPRGSITTTYKWNVQLGSVQGNVNIDTIPKGPSVAIEVEMKHSFKPTVKLEIGKLPLPKAGEYMTLGNQLEHSWESIGHAVMPDFQQFMRECFPNNNAVFFKAESYRGDAVIKRVDAFCPADAERYRDMFNPYAVLIEGVHQDMYNTQKLVDPFMLVFLSPLYSSNSAVASCVEMKYVNFSTERYGGDGKDVQRIMRSLTMLAERSKTEHRNFRH